MKATIVFTGKLNKKLLIVSYIETIFSEPYQIIHKGDFVEIETIKKAYIGFNCVNIPLPIGTFSFEITTTPSCEKLLHHKGAIKSVTYYNYKSYHRRPLIWEYSLQIGDVVGNISSGLIGFYGIPFRRVYYTCSYTRQQMEDVKEDMKTGMYEFYKEKCKERLLNKYFGDATVKRCVDLFTLLL